MAEKTIASPRAQVKAQSPQSRVPHGDSTDLVEVVSRRVVASSLNVAVRFGKRHTNVLRAIENLIADCPLKFTGLNFELSDYTDPTGRALPMYLLTRDAFALLVMGFTGKEALAWKIRYIEAFNAMERELANGAWYNPKIHLLAGALAAQLARETPARREFIQKVLSHAELGYGGTHIARYLNIGRRFPMHPERVRRVLRRYAAYRKDYWRLADLAKEHLPSPEQISEKERQRAEMLAFLQESRRIRRAREARHETV